MFGPTTRIHLHSFYYPGYRSCFSGPAEPSVGNCVKDKKKSKDDDVEDDAFEGPSSSEEEPQPGDRTTLLILSSGGNSTGMGKNMSPRLRYNASWQMRRAHVT